MREMITSKKELLDALKCEKTLYLGNGFIHHIKLFLLCDHDYELWTYVKSLRVTEYHYNCKHKVRFYFSQRRKNKLGQKLGITIWHNCIDIGLRIWHYGNIVVNGHAKIGKNCHLHGGNCIGNKGDEHYDAPTIGDNVEIGFGAAIIGGISIANNCKIGANAVVLKSCDSESAILVGVPATITIPHC